MHKRTDTYSPMGTGRGFSLIPSIVLVFAIIGFCNCMIAVADATGSGDEEQGISANMSDAAHSSKAEPDYAAVFPGDQVNMMTITISPANWKIMLDNMTELYGEFGGGSFGAPGAQAGDAGMNQGESPGAGGMFSETDPVYVPADITFNGMEWPSVGIRFKGFNSLQGAWNEGSYKISLKLNFDKYEDVYPEIKNQHFYGFGELNLQGNYNDDSLVRDMVVPSIFRESGVPAPYTAFYRLYVDYGEGPVYFGLYTMVEAIEDTVIETQFEDDSGNLYKPEGNGASFAEGTFDKGSFEKKTNEDEADYSDVEALYTILNSDSRITDPEQWRSDLESIFDIDVFLRWLATNIIIQNWDTYGGNCRNFYLYTDPSSGTITWIPWDNNYALNGGMGGGGGFPSADLSGVQATGGVEEVTGSSSQKSGSSRMGIAAMNTTRSLARFSRNSVQQFSLDSGNAGWTDAEGGGLSGESTTPGTLISANVPQGGMSPGNMTPGNMPPGNMTPGNMPPGNMTPGSQNNTPGGGMGRTLSLSLDEVGDNWPLIRYIADDPVYYAKYQEYLGVVATTSFEPAKMEEIYRYYHSLIEPYVTGPEGEQAGYTHLDNPSDFNTALDELITHVNSRYEAVMEFLSTTPVVTPTPTPVMVKDTIAPTVGMTSPSSYSIAAPGRDIVVAWSATDNVRVESVSLAWSGNRGATWTQIASNLPAVGTFTWTVPDYSGSLLTVRVSAEDAAGNSGSASRILRVSSSVSGSFGRTVNSTAIRDSIDVPSSIRDCTSAGDSSQGASVVAIPSIISDPDEAVSRFRGPGFSRSTTV